MDPNLFPPIPKSEQELLADQHTVTLRILFGDERAEHLFKVKLAIVQYVATRTQDQQEGLAVLGQCKEALELAIKISTNNDPQAN